MSGSGDYISREAAFEECDWYANEFSECEYAIMPLKGALEILPAADVRPVRKGKWIDHQEGRWVYAKCSECETVHDVRSNFCPNCGADMMEES